MLHEYELELKYFGREYSTRNQKKYVGITLPVEYTNPYYQYMILIPKEHVSYQRHVIMLNDVGDKELSFNPVFRSADQKTPKKVRISGKDLCDIFERYKERTAHSEKEKKKGIYKVR